MESGALVAGVLATLVALLVMFFWPGKRANPFYPLEWVERFQRPEWQGLRRVLFALVLLGWLAMGIRVIDELL